MGRFFNNSAHTVGRFGLWIFPGYTPTVTGACNDNTPKVAKFEHFKSFRNDKGAEWVMSAPLQFRNFVVFDHEANGIETKTIRFAQNINSGYGSLFYNDASGSTIADSVIIGNSDQNALTNSENGIVLAWDRSQLIQNISFYNFPDPNTHVLRATVIVGRCS
jgi:hypothetical protein